MRVAAIGDIHLSRYSQDKLEDKSNLPERLHSIKSAIYEVAQYCIDNNIRKLIIAGDILHGKSIIYAVAQDIMIQYFKDFSDLEFIVIDGNHDLSGKGASVVSALRPLETIPNVQWVPYNERLYVEDEDILFIPYSHEVVQKVKENKANILVSHFGLNEGVLNSGISIISDIGLNDLSGRYKLVILGHYHKPQEIIREDIKLYYTGSPIQLDWGEKGDEKRFLVFDTETLDVESIPIKSYKRHIEVEITEENREDAIKIAKQEKDAGHHVKVIMKDHVDIDDIKNDFAIIDKTDKDITDRGISSTMSQRDKINRFLEIKNISDDKKERYTNIALEIMDSEV